ncbi:MAG TPA: hypothetical protein VN784_09185 [Candidatus Limnocylindrales bacterium]|nr:hypothetical protein [Candidatus Limnocylindrales bacterium]
MPDLEYKITTSAELSGAQAALEALDRQIGRAKALKQDYAELQAQRDTVAQSLKENVAITNDAADAEDALGKKTEEFNVHGRSQFLLFSEINRIMPGLGESMHAAFAGPLGPIILAGIAIAAAKKALDGYNAALDAMGESAAKPFGESVQDLQTMWDTATQSLGKYEAALDAAGTDRDPTSTMIQRQKELDEARLEGIKTAIIAEGKLEEATLRASMAGQDPKKITAAVEAAKERNQAVVDSLDAGKKAAELQKELDESLAKQPELHKAAQAAEQPAQTAAAKAKNLEDTLKHLRAANAPGAKAADEAAGGLTTIGDLNKLMQLRQDMEDLRAGKLAAPQEMARRVANIDFSGMTRDQVDNAIRNASHALDLQRSEQIKLEKNAEDIFEAQATADEALATAREAEKKNQQRIGALPGEISQAKSVESQKDIGEEIGGAYYAAQDYVAGKALTKSQNETIASLKTMLDQAHENSQAILQLILDGVKKHESLAQVVHDLQSRHQSSFLQ